MNTASVVPEFPSVTETLLMVTEAVSLSLIVPTASPSRITGPELFDRCTRNVSAGSSIRSPLTVTVNVRDLVAAGKDSVPDVAT